MEIHIHIYDTAQTVAEKFAGWFDNWIHQQEEKPLHIALSGGSTPEILFRHLADQYAEKLPWERLHFWWGDERCVPPTDQESNYRMAKETLLDKVGIPEANVHRVLGENPSSEEVIRYAEEIQQSIPAPHTIPQFDLVMLGMGDDGHTASIFPNQIDLLEDENLTAVATKPGSLQQRITFTGTLLNAADTVAFLVTGPRKAGRAAQILGGRPGARHLPAYHIQPSEGVLHWFLDNLAAADLRG